LPRASLRPLTRPAPTLESDEAGGCGMRCGCSAMVHSLGQSRRLFSDSSQAAEIVVPAAAAAERTRMNSRLKPWSTHSSDMLSMVLGVALVLSVSVAKHTVLPAGAVQTPLTSWHSEMAVRVPSNFSSYSW